MSDKPFIGGQPMFENPFDHCTFLGRLSGYDLYLTNVPGKAPDVLARSGNEPGEYIEGLKLSYGENRPLTTARRIAEYKQLLVINPVKSMLHAHHEQDVATVKKALPGTPEYAVLEAYQMGRTQEAYAHVESLVSSSAMLDAYPDNELERLRHVDMNLFLVGRYLSDVFTPATYTEAARANFAARGVSQVGPSA